MPRDLRSFLKDYEASYPEDIVRIDREVSCNQEITRIVQLLEKQNRYPLLIFNNVLNPAGKKAAQTLVTNVSSSRVRIARICGTGHETLGRYIFEATRTRRREPEVITRSQAPVKEVIKTGK
ncbi:MAG: hypothetical protein V1780_01875, partial [Chloroflexota bacterium]